MENYQSLASQVQTPVGQLKLKDSIRDMIRLQHDYQLSDESFWEVFDARVLLNEQIDVNSFLSDLNAPVALA